MCVCNDMTSVTPTLIHHGPCNSHVDTPRPSTWGYKDRAKPFFCIGTATSRSGRVSIFFFLCGWGLPTTAVLGCQGSDVVGCSRQTAPFFPLSLRRPAWLASNHSPNCCVYFRTESHVRTCEQCDGWWILGRVISKEGDCGHGTRLVFCPELRGHRFEHSMVRCARLTCASKVLYEA